MPRLPTILTTLLLPMTILASPLSSRQTTAAQQILQIAPNSANCTNAPYPSECATATQAAPYLIATFSNYTITSSSQIAAVISLMAFETADFKYNINHFPSPGRPGQGTRNMQMADFNLEYAMSFPELVGQVQGITGGVMTASALSDEQVNEVRGLVLGDQYCWGSGAWFLMMKCGDDVRSAMETPGEEGFAAYMGCVGTAVTDDRLAYYNRALKAFGLS